MGKNSPRTNNSRTKGCKMKNTGIYFGWDWKSFLVGIDTAFDNDYWIVWIELGFLEIKIGHNNKRK